MASVRLDNVTKCFGDIEVVKKSFLEVKDGEFMVLVGPSGCGKTTTLRMIAGLEEVSEGRIFIGDRDVTDVHPKDRDIAMVFQNYALYPHMTVYDNMAFALKMRKFSAREIKQRVENASTILGLDNLLKRKPKALSGGQRQRVALGRAIVRQPAVFLMDEPLSNLDANLRVSMRGELKKLHHDLKATVVYVTHDQVEAMTLGNRIVIMSDGLIQEVDDPIAIYDNPCNLFVAGFIGSPPMNFLSGQVRKEDQKFVFDTGAFKVWLPVDLYSSLEPLQDREFILGVRPEDILDKHTAELQKKDYNIQNAKVSFSEVLGSENYLHLSLGTQKFIAKVDSHINPVPGEHVEIAMDLHKMHLFDKETTKAII